MSLQGLISGSECAVPFNPLSQVLKHTEGDRSLQQDRIAGPSSSQLRHLPGTSSAHGTERDLAMARQFFDGPSQGPMSQPAFAMPLNMAPPQMGQSMSTGPDLSSAWNTMPRSHPMPEQVLRGDVPKMAGSSGWANEFDNVSRASPAPPAVQHGMASQLNSYQTPYMQAGMYGGAMSMGMYSSNFAPPPGLLQGLDKGKGKSRDIDFEAAFAQAAASFTSSQTEGARIVEVDESVTELSETLQNANLQENAQELTGKAPDFKEVWEQLQNSDLPPPKEEIGKWESQFNQLMNSERDDSGQYGDAMQSSWEAGLGDFENAFGEQSIKFDDEGLPILGTYVFEQENKYLQSPLGHSSALRDAKALLEQNGSLSEAALLLEAAIQQGDLGTGGYEAWILLGDVRSMDEREEQGMRALREGVRLAEEAGAAGEGMLSLAISYTNESFERASHTMLLRWLKARFPSLEIPEETWKSLSNSAWHSHEQVTEAFLRLAREQHAAGQMDPDVQIGLGVLFYTNAEFNRAKDCFEAALSARPRDYLLWNRLGSSLSNGNHPEEALGAYREALQLRPTYTRAIYNVGVACLNIGAHKEAAEHFLSALAMQETTGGTKSDQLWFTLRRAFLSMNRGDLAEMAKATTNVEVFRKEGFDF